MRGQRYIFKLRSSLNSAIPTQRLNELAHCRLSWSRVTSPVIMDKHKITWLSDKTTTSTAMRARSAESQREEQRRRRRRRRRRPQSLCLMDIVSFQYRDGYCYPTRMLTGSMGLARRRTEYCSGCVSPVPRPFDHSHRAVADAAFSTLPPYPSLHPQFIPSAPRHVTSRQQRKAVPQTDFAPNRKTCNRHVKSQTAKENQKARAAAARAASSAVASGSASTPQPIASTSTSTSAFGLPSHLTLDFDVADFDVVSPSASTSAFQGASASSANAPAQVHDADSFTDTAWALARAAEQDGVKSWSGTVHFRDVPRWSKTVSERYAGPLESPRSPDPSGGGSGSGTAVGDKAKAEKDAMLKRARARAAPVVEWVHEVTGFSFV